jgi:hypothetical protein
VAGRRLPITDHELWSPSCRFIKGFVVGNIPMTNQKHLKNLPVLKMCVVNLWE